MGHVVDQWTRPDPKAEPGRKRRRVRTDRWGRGKRWLARWTESDGRERAKAFDAKDAAEAHLTAVDGALRAGTYVRESRTTFREYATTWLAQQVHQRPDTAALAESRLRLYAYPLIGDKRLGVITRSDVQGIVVAATTLGPSATRILYVYVRAVFAAAVEDRLIPVSPCRRINLPEVTRELVVPMTVNQVMHVRAHVPRHLERMVLVAAGTGMRPGELRGLTVDRVMPGAVRVDRQLAAGTSASRVVFGPLKTSASPRVVSLAPSTEKALLEHLELFAPGPSGLVFTSYRGGPLRRSQLTYAWQVGAGGLGLPRRSGWHDLRHHHASLLIGAGRSPRAVADRLGHADPSETLRTYSHLWGSDEARILDAIEAAYGGAGPGSGGAGAE